MQQKNILCVDCDPSEIESIRKNLVYHGESFYTYSEISNGKRTGKVSELKRYKSYFSVGWKMFKNRNNICSLIGWQQFHALIFVFFCNLFKVKKNTKVIALNFTYKEKNRFNKVYKCFMKKCLDSNYLDYLHVPSYEYADMISKEFSFPRGRIIVTPFGIDDCFDEYSKLGVPEGYLPNSYALALGRSNRDFQFLIDCWDNIDYPLVIISDTFEGTTNNKNITIKHDVVGKDSYPWIANCLIMIIPLKDESICSGDTVLLKAMACKKIVVVTVPSTLAEMYIKNEVNGYAIAKNKEIFSKKINEIIKSDDVVGKQARIDFLDNFSRARFGIIISSILNSEVNSEDG